MRLVPAAPAAPPLAQSIAPPLAPRPRTPPPSTAERTPSGARACRRYYDPAAFNTSRLYPLGGPIGGGTELTVYLINPAMLTDLGGGAHGVHCRFSHMRIVRERHRVPLMATERHQVPPIASDCLWSASGCRWASSASDSF